MKGKDDSIKATELPQVRGDSLVILNMDQKLLGTGSMRPISILHSLEELISFKVMFQWDQSVQNGSKYLPVRRHQNTF